MPLVLDDSDAPSFEVSLLEQSHDHAPQKPQPDDTLLEILSGSGFAWSTDWVAAYASWHLHGSNWGIRISGSALESLTASIADHCGAPVPRLRPIVLRQVVHHEWAHFAIELLAWELQLRVRSIFYPRYITDRYGQALGGRLPAPIEEVIASHREVAFARGPLPLSLRPKPAGYLSGVKHALSRSQSGYRDWWLIDKPADRASVGTAHLSLLMSGLQIPVLSRSQLRLALGTPTPGQRAQVPLTWFGDPALAADYGLTLKSSAPPTIARFEKWLRQSGAHIDTRGGKGTHRKARLPGGQTISYAAGHGILLRPEAQNLVRVLGLRSLVDLYEHVAEMRTPKPTLVRGISS